ncbi:MAG: glycosyltransferase family 4 protein [Chloroflexi bacterium AL-W]|nr:glycosyltransferase family 4 protein [Chloroflexi bacterium AL-N1]NOK64580.1 glycosyltransferase family 4 protein [Chloroflexi bacterium AL-N10]NOK75822.1 glycosyltransferase family 4 protein [Chloroflexi bacterium AL-N5]NOK80419.1 glycosyltransferase family 4 protein [Chloroflexi bacterium AL-W]NOK86933.1 glycosyltransferase family 4 protein [Chloroflexi bacterium AL-N15]
MRVLLISHSLVTRSNHRLPEELACYPDLQLDVLTPEWWNEESRIVYQEKTEDSSYRIHCDQVIYYRQPKPNLFLFRSTLAHLLHTVKPDIIDAQEEPFSLAMGQILALRKLYAPQAKLLFYSFQNLYKRYPLPFSGFEQWAFRVASHACVSASEISDVLRRKGYCGQVVLNPPGVDPAIFYPSPEARASIRATFSIALDQPVLGYLGRLSPEKGIQDIIYALSSLPMNTRLLIVGGGVSSEIKHLAQQFGVADRLILTGAINRVDVPRYLNAMDILIVPSRTTPRWKEQFGRVIAEASMCGVPVIGSSSGAIPEVVGENGLIFPEGNIRMLAVAVHLLLDQPHLRHELGTRAHRHARQHFTWEQVAKDRYTLYQEMFHG